MDKYQEMRVFSAVVDAGSFVRAADALQISKAAASRYVSDLEERLGVRLLHRTTRKLALTAEGEVFLARCRDILSSIEASEIEVSTGSSKATGLLKLSVPLSFGVTHLAPLWARFMERHPGVALDVNLSDRVVDLLEEGFDLAIRIARLPDSSLVSRKLASTQLILCASPDYLKRCGAPAHPAELSNFEVIGYTLLAIGDNWEFNGPTGTVRVKVSPRLRANNGETCVAAALDGAGIVLQPTFLVESHLKSGRLVQLLPGYQSLQLDVFAVYPTRKFVLPKVRALMDYLAEAFARVDWSTTPGTPPASKQSSASSRKGLRR